MYYKIKYGYLSYGAVPANKIFLPHKAAFFLIKKNVVTFKALSFTNGLEEHHKKVRMKYYICIMVS